jgi:hypothetical protein
MKPVETIPGMGRGGKRRMIQGAGKESDRGGEFNYVYGKNFG